MAATLVFIFVITSATKVLALPSGDAADECELPVDVVNCCMPSRTIISAMMVTQQLFSKCIADMNIIINNRRPSTEVIECLMECTFNASNWLTGDSKLNNEALTAAVSALTSEPIWQGALDAARDVCIKKNVASSVKEDAQCKSGSLQILECFLTELYLNCPEEAWRGDKKMCSEGKEIVRKCPIRF